MKVLKKNRLNICICLIQCCKCNYSLETYVEQFKQQKTLLYLVKVLLQQYQEFGVHEGLQNC